MAPSPQLETDEEEVLAANRAFYAALQELDLEQMEAIWLHEDWVRCLHPGWELLVGWEEVQASWADIFRSTLRMLVAISRTLVRVHGDTAWVSCLENVTSTHEGGFSTALAEATNLFVRQDSRWLLVHHHTTPLAKAAPSGSSNRIQ